MGSGAKNPKYDKFKGEVPTGAMGGYNTPMASGAPIAYTGAFGQPSDQFADTTSGMRGGSAPYIPEGAPDSSIVNNPRMQQPQRGGKSPQMQLLGAQFNRMPANDLGYDGGFNPEMDYMRRRGMR